MEKADKLKYGSILSGLDTQQSLDNHQFPKTITEANKVLSNHQFDVHKEVVTRIECKEKESRSGIILTVKRNKKSVFLLRNLKASATAVDK
jgi:hypothetical protein